MPSGLGVVGRGWKGLEGLWLSQLQQGYLACLQVDFYVPLFSMEYLLRHTERAYYFYSKARK